MCCEAMSVVEEEEFENGASGKGGTRFSPEAAKTKWIRSTKDFDFDGRQHQPTGHQTQRPLKGNAQLPAGAWVVQAVWWSGSIRTQVRRCAQVLCVHVSGAASTVEQLAWSSGPLGHEHGSHQLDQRQAGDVGYAPQASSPKPSNVKP
ncbi:hypothetical protein X797_003947 [Metarhizium robertsii]|uniref:Uncharacterized protein n=2 Tax=Metarhizium robertsii TaxID=568076 RepID=E9EVT0_METRA|nr:uncharacterized protein MAA_04129 [Metarhizium robertsii ARSEF 23]EFZ00352.1 hypothetical protein MAA_04129 [Metarhizium robertsii ARSEF 23]EXV02824.1 hypothetical protein X797_003947 [Metarhizium robertsii]